MTRNGKIARLPQAIREQINHRLDNGEEGKQIAAWLNTLPEVTSLMAAEFDSQPGDDESAFLSYDLTASCVYPPAETWEMPVAAVYDRPQSQMAWGAHAPSHVVDGAPAVNPSCPLFIGVDIGRFRDLTVIRLMEKLGRLAIPGGKIVVKSIDLN